MTKELTKLQKLDVVERRDLRKLEAIVEQGKRAFIETGRALREIRDRQLYKEEFTSFESYVKERFSITKQHAYRLLSAVGTAERLKEPEEERVTHGLPSENQAPPERSLREIARLPEDQQKEAWDEIKQASDNPTLSEVKQAVDQRLGVASPETPQDADSDASADATDEPQGDVPEYVRDALKAASVHKRICSQINECLRLVKEVTEVPGTELLVMRQRSVIAELENAKNSVSLAMPYSVCPRCGGAGCPQCGNLGWVNRIISKELGGG